MSQRKMHEVNELLLPSYSWATIVMAWWFVRAGGGGGSRQCSALQLMVRDGSGVRSGVGEERRR